LSGWLAVQEIVGRRFATYSTNGQPACMTGDGNCAMLAYEREYGEQAHHNVAQAFPEGDASPLYRANDLNRGDPAAVRRELHRQFPLLSVLPGSPHPTEASTDGR
jgi:hypothetical protein